MIKYQAPSDVARTIRLAPSVMSGHVSLTTAASRLVLGASLLSSLPWWEGVRGRGTGPFLTGTLMFEKRLVAEVDGGQHGEEAIARREQERTTWLNGKGYRVVRFRKSDIPGDLEGLLDRIAEALRGDGGTPSPYPSPVKGEGMVNRGTNGWPTPSLLLVLPALIYVENKLVGPFSPFAGPDSSG